MIVMKEENEQLKKYKEEIMVKHLEMEPLEESPSARTPKATQNAQAASSNTGSAIFFSH